MNNKIEIVTADKVNLTNCDREQIHIPGSIQPHGVLLVLKEPELDIIQVSNNTKDWLNVLPEDLLKQNIKYLLEPQQIDSIRNSLTGDFEYLNPLKLSIKCGDETKSFNSIVHRNNGVLILELEPCEIELEQDFFQFYQLTRRTITQIQKSANLQELCSIVVKEIRRLTEVDRVMIYRFHPDNSGEVIAEDKWENLESYLGLHYPASDIPESSRHLYSINYLRIIPDINYQPVELLPKNNPLTNQPLDLSFSVLRSVSPIHIEYLQNMGVKASMSISLLKEGKLWGLIVCHHYSIKYIPYNLRTVCDFFGQVMSVHITTKEQHDNLDYKIYLKSLQSQVITDISESENLLMAFTNIGEKLLTIVGATGAIVYGEGELQKIGKTIKDEEVEPLLNWVITQINTDVYYTDYLAKVYPPANKFKEIASGLLVLEITKVKKNYVLWFRPEVSQIVNWAGNPQKHGKVELDGSITLLPRKSFAKWLEIVECHSLPWQSYEIEGAQELKSAILGILMSRIDKLAEINLELEQSNSDLDSFNYIASHDLKEPLRGIHNYATFLMEDYGEILEADGQQKLQTLVRLTQRMEDLINALLFLSRLGRQELNKSPINLNELIENVAEVIRMSKPNESIEIIKKHDLPVIYGDNILMEEVFGNLINNGVKYNQKTHKIIEIGYKYTEEYSCLIYVKDNGIGIREKHIDTIFKLFKRLHGKDKFGGGTGVGLTIVKKIIERHGGKIWLESNYGEGTTFYIKLSEY
ncbi:MAG: GAF domain-containing protein [Okeania sp. SIO3B5]|uniref:ATP-binding protein n=1 Tax=Okeania sp. SIO3B5 TaxID=2607811 RepID=UPI0013FF3C8A|nr:ATP-binding protein [Okeania sp. SIO3B5]NEO54285.1 GAF domain-containing protein [Okeania sp. SIO3B5]